MLFNTVDRDTKLRQGTLGTVMSLAEKTQAERTIMTFFKKQAVAYTYRGRSSSCPQNMCRDAHLHIHTCADVWSSNRYTDKLLERSAHTAFIR